MIFPLQSDLFNRDSENQFNKWCRARSHDQIALYTSSLIELLYIVRCPCYGYIHSPEIKLFWHWYHKRLLPCVLPRVADLYLNSSITYPLKAQGNQLNGFVKIGMSMVQSANCSKLFGTHSRNHHAGVPYTFWKWVLSDVSKSVTLLLTAKSRNMDIICNRETILFPLCLSVCCTYSPSPTPPPPLSEVG